MSIHVTDTQRDGNWLQARLGHATASRAKDMLSKGRGNKPSDTRRGYIIELVTERITGNVTQSYQSVAMQWGTEQEINARLAYGNVNRCEVEEVGFIRHKELAAGCSPDGFVDWDGMIEIKCPYNSDVHIKTILDGMPEDHRPQVLMQLWVTGRDWVDFVSYDPRMPNDLAMYVQRIKKRDEDMRVIEEEVRKFLDEVDATEAAIKNRRKHV